MLELQCREFKITVTNTIKKIFLKDSFVRKVISLKNNRVSLDWYGSVG